MYVKLFSSLYQGTLRGCSDEILVFTNLLAHADVYGIVDKHWRAIAEETGLTRERVEAAVLTLESPDPESRSAEIEGRRIIKMDEHRAWGWKIVNYGKYRSIKNEDDRREQNRIAQEKFRNKNKLHFEIVSTSKQSKPWSAQAEAEEEVNKSTTLSGNPDVHPLSESKINGKRSEAIEILDFLNAKTSRRYRPVSANLDMIGARLKEGATLAECKQVIAKKVREWLADEKMNLYLRPATLFAKVKFAQYQGELWSGHD